jgi:hypothetical protein
MFFCINSSVRNQSARSASGLVYVTNCISIRKRQLEACHIHLGEKNSGSPDDPVGLKDS